MLGRLFAPATARRNVRQLGSAKVLSAVGLLVVLSGVHTIYGDDEIASDDEPSVPLLRRLVSDAASRYRTPSQESPSSKADNTLRKYEGSGVIKGDTGIARFDVISVPCGSIKCSELALSSVQLNTGNSWTFFGLYDGRNGPHTSDYLGRVLLATLFDSLLSVYSKYTAQPDQHMPLEYSTVDVPPDEPLSSALDQSFKAAFLEIDRNIVESSAEILSSKVPRSRAVGLTGDSRAVLGRNIGRHSGRAVYNVHVLTAEHDTNNQAELSRLRELHPDENLMVDNRLLGRTTILRSFGDAALKWSNDVQQRLREDYFGDRPLPSLKTPPYITAEPEVTTFEVQPGDFLILGSSGLWKSLTNEEAVGLVGVWLENQSTPFDEDNILRPPGDGQNDDEGQGRIIRRDQLPIRLREDDTYMYSRWRTEKKFITVDNNAATHLARNALGGADRDLTDALLSVFPPFAARLRPDISTTVVFFKD
ncbi:PPM-type phosphatase-like domain superfamily protein [Pleurotus pulmonarius]